MKAIEEKAVKEVKIIEELKKQLQKKLVIIKEKNKALIDHQRKANEGEKKLLELQQEDSKIPELEIR
ncbi:putative beta-galactosidase 7-like [Cocos nucifera]|uniref:Putative beta-galactosidase 7-like n=1 Tax=Cocos nucifera TaxID=13894 RepID=A0A8K0IVP7_COCNU|nr:putative beta-galactosidase 7-like [Cocos nucifera]